VGTDSGTGIADIMFSEVSDDFDNGESWVTFAARRNYVFQNTANGAKTVYTRVRDFAGRVSNVVADDITKDAYTKITATTYSEPITLLKAQSPYLVESNGVIFDAPTTLEAGVVINITDGRTLSFKGKVIANGTATAAVTIRHVAGGMCDSIIQFNQGLPGSSSKTQANYVRFLDVGNIYFNGGTFSHPKFENDACGRGINEKDGEDRLLLDQPTFINWGTVMDVKDGLEAVTIKGGGGNVYSLFKQEDEGTKSKLIGGTYTVDDDGTGDPVVRISNGDMTIEGVTVTGMSSKTAFNNEGAGTVTLNDINYDECNTGILNTGDGGVVATGGQMTDCGYFVENYSASASEVKITGMTLTGAVAAVSWTNPGEQITFDHNDITVSEAVARLDSTGSKSTFTNNVISCANDGTVNAGVCDILYVRNPDVSAVAHHFTLTDNNIACATSGSGKGCRGFMFDNMNASSNVTMTMSVDDNYWGTTRVLDTEAFDTNLVVDDDGTGGVFSTPILAYKVNFGAQTLSGLPVMLSNAAAAVAGAGP
jgi:hypothetical protein